MNNSTIWWIILILVVLLGAYFLFVNRGEAPTTPPVPTVSEPAPSGSVTPETSTPTTSNPTGETKNGATPDQTKGTEGGGSSK